MSIKLLHDKFNIFTAASEVQANFSKNAMYFDGFTVLIQAQIKQALGDS